MLPPSKLVTTVQIDEITDNERCCVTNKIPPSDPLLVIVNIKRAKKKNKQHCLQTSYYRHFHHYTGFVQVLENLESPGISFWNFPALESPGKRPLVLESSGNLLNATKCSKRLLWKLFTVAIKPNYLAEYGRQ